MVGINIRQVDINDVDGCYMIESSCYTSDGATKEKILKRAELFPEGFLIAESEGEIIGIINSASTDKEEITDEELKDMVGHVKEGRNMVIFSLAVLPELQGNGISRQLMTRFIEVSKGLKKEKILLICKSDMIHYYQNFGFLCSRKSKSQHGGFEWHEMYLLLNTVDEI
ncbi:MAG: GNAT family N-acetyltransferase [Candidatus Scalindua sp.]|jgi:ribosomal protein S18 acetylase RimI-like enzyme|nr:GNAT family N-acetyltransferase [Candidatus Scalindua sp.]MDV5166430.1 GNAT family N-acetyltransferase [Candidatus Scalindua sp.]